VVESTEEAIVNAMIAAPTMTGADGFRLFGLPHEELRAILKRYGRSARRSMTRAFATQSDGLL